MDFDANIEQMRLAFWQIIQIAGPILLIALVMGLVIGIVQAATSINEMTLSFVPKLVVVLLSIALFSSFMMVGLSDYFGYIFASISDIK